MSPAARPGPQLLLVVALGGAVGAVLRAGAGELHADAGGFPWTTLAVNLVGTTLLAALPLVARVRRSRLLAAALGPGLLGGFTTLSAVSDETRALLADGAAVTAAAYVGATLGATLLAVSVVAALGSRTRRAPSDGDVG